jgi:hypothetical protein
MALEKRKAIIEIDLEGVFPLEISDIADRREFAFAEWGFEWVKRFHRRPSFTISSIIFTTLRGGIYTLWSGGPDIWRWNIRSARRSSGRPRSKVIVVRAKVIPRMNQ